MTMRRTHPRLAPGNPWPGTLRILREVIVRRHTGDELLTIGQTHGVPGETMLLDLVGFDTSLTLTVRVLDSEPVLIDSVLRHRVRFLIVDGESSKDPGATPLRLDSGRQET
jgi:hypothetical protein